MNNKKYHNVGTVQNPIKKSYKETKSKPLIPKYMTVKHTES